MSCNWFIPLSSALKAFTDLIGAAAHDVSCIMYVPHSASAKVCTQRHWLTISDKIHVLYISVVGGTWNTYLVYPHVYIIEFLHNFIKFKYFPFLLFYLLFIWCFLWPSMDIILSLDLCWWYKLLSLDLSWWYKLLSLDLCWSSLFHEYNHIRILWSCHMINCWYGVFNI